MNESPTFSPDYQEMQDALKRLAPYKDRLMFLIAGCHDPTKGPLYNPGESVWGRYPILMEDIQIEAGLDDRAYGKAIAELIGEYVQKRDTTDQG